MIRAPLTALLLGTAAVIGASGPAWAEPAAPVERVSVVRDDGGIHLRVADRPFMIRGMNWGYMPIGHNYRYDFWGNDDAFIESVLEEEMGLLRAMGVNAIRQFSDVPPRWIAYIHKRFGIYTVVNHLFGRYGFTVNGTWVSSTNYQDPEHRKAILESVIQSAETYRETPGVLLYLLGNENNYGLEWTSFEIENLPKDERHKAKAQYLYSLFGEAVDHIHRVDPNRPVSLANGDLQYLDLIIKHAPNLDILASNVYRGVSMGDLYKRVLEEAKLPVFFSEFGCDAYDALRGEESTLPQADFLLRQWREIYEQSWGKGQVGNALGGFVFQWSDGWWKYRQEERLDVHDTNASWANGGYPFDFVQGKNNMNEEWWGITSKGHPDATGRYRVHPRPAYYALKEAFSLDPYDPSTTPTRIREHFAQVEPRDYLHRYVAEGTKARVAMLERVRVTQLRMRMDTVTTGGELRSDVPGTELQFDHLQSFYAGVGLSPVKGFDGEVVVNVLGNVPTNPIDEIFYERRGQRIEVQGDDGEPVVISDPERVKIHAAKFEWDEDWMNLKGFYRTGHYHWGYEGDFFGLYREANYGPNIDIYDADVPLGMEFTGKKWLDGLKVAFGPQLYWGANPSIISKYHRRGPVFEFALMHQEDIALQTSVATSLAIPEPLTRKSTLHMGMNIGGLKWEIGGIFAGMDRVGQRFLSARRTDGDGYLDSGYALVDDTVHALDTLGAKTKLTYEGSGLKWYLQGAYKGVVADGGPDGTVTLTGWRMKEDGRGNHFSALTGLAVDMGPFQIAPNVLYQRPLEGPLPSIGDQFSAASGDYYPGARPRNVLDDPFAVLGNRETLGLELLLVYDPTPGTWLWAWDNLIHEDAVFAGALDFIYRHQPTARDSGVGFTADGQMQPFHATPPAHDSWEVHGKWVSNPGGGLRLAGDLFVGSNQANAGGSPELDRQVLRYGATLRTTWRRLVMSGFVKIDDWGPYDYHRDYNFTYPLQIMGDLSWALVKPKWLYEDFARFGVRYHMRLTDEHSNRFGGEPGERGYEYEVRTYVDLML